MAQYIQGLGALARVFERATLLQEAMTVAVAGAASTVLYEHAHETFGDRTKLADLAPATQDDRTKKGYSPNDPLLRDGTLLRDSVERVHEGNLGGVGSNEPVMLYHEYGYHNARTGTDVPPRPVFRIAMVESAPEIEAIIATGVKETLGLGVLKILPT